MASKNNLQDEAMQNAANATYVSDATNQYKQQLDNMGTNPYAVFQTSDKTNNAYGYLQNTLANRPQDYQSNYQGTINNLLDQIVNRKEFSYDFNADPLYQQYKNQYTAGGKQAMQDTIAQASNMTGGYGNSYATTAGSQAYQNYLSQLNNIIPELYDKALNKYQMDGEELRNKYNVVGTQEDREYGQWSDNMGIWQNDRNFGLDQYNNFWNQDMSEQSYNSDNWLADRNFLYGQYRDSVGDDQNAYNNAYTSASNAQNYDYQVGRDAVNDDRWAQEFAYQKERDAISDRQWAAEYALKQASKNSGTNTKQTEKTEEEMSADLTSNGMDAYNYVKYIMNNTYGADGENAAVGNLVRMVNEGKITENDFDLIYSQLGISDDQISKSEWSKYL